jgi:ketosteroid isomerase-like protein
MSGVSRAWELGDLRSLRKLLHPDGVWMFVGAEPRAISDPDELIEAIREEQETTAYNLSPHTNHELSENVVLATGFIRTALPNGRGHRMSHYAFLTEVRDGLFHRSEVFASEEEAREAFWAGWESTANVPLG